MKMFVLFVPEWRCVGLSNLFYMVGVSGCHITVLRTHFISQL